MLQPSILKTICIHIKMLNITPLRTLLRQQQTSRRAAIPKSIVRTQPSPSTTSSRTFTSTRHNRQAQTSAPHHNPSPNPTARPDLLYRDPLRPLPTLASLSSNRRWWRTLPIFAAIITCSALAIFNYQKTNSPIITATLYSLRTNPTVREVLGDEVYFGSKWAWVWGSINLVQGRVDVQFAVKGTKSSGMCRFKAKRLGGKSGLVSLWCLLDG